MIFYFYYPLKDRLAVDLFRDMISGNFDFLVVGPLVDHLVDDHPLPHFKIECPETEIEAVKEELHKVSTQFSIRIMTTPETWLGRIL